MVSPDNTLECAEHGEVIPRVYRQLMLTGGEHLRAECPECRRWLKFVPHTEPWLAMVEERPEQGALL